MLYPCTHVAWWAHESRSVRRRFFLQTHSALVASVDGFVEEDAIMATFSDPMVQVRLGL